MSNQILSQLAISKSKKKKQLIIFANLWICITNLFIKVIKKEKASLKNLQNQNPSFDFEFFFFSKKL